MLTKKDIKTLSQMKELVKLKGSITSYDIKILKIKEILECDMEEAIRVRNILVKAKNNYGYETLVKIIDSNIYREGFLRALEICNKRVK